MEASAVSYRTFEAITLSDVSLSGLFILCRDFASNKGLRAKFAILWILLSASFILAFPTLMSAMTGYSANTRVFVKIDNQLIPFSEFRLIRYVIYDGWRVGLNGSYFITVNANISTGNSARWTEILRTSQLTLAVKEIGEDKLTTFDKCG